MKRIVTAAAIGVAALSLTTTGAVAGSLVTSKQIKNGTIKVRDLAPSTVQALRGAQGAVAAAYYQRTRQEKVQPGTNPPVRVACDPGDLAVGGYMRPGGFGDAIETSYPESPTGGEVWVFQLTSGDVDRLVGLYVMCVER